MHLHNAYPPLGKAGLAVGKIHAPQPSKTLVVAQIFKPRASGLKVGAPADCRPRCYIFGLTLWPQDFFYMALLMIIAALSLFFLRQ